MLSRSNEQDLLTIARYARNNNTLVSLISNPVYSNNIKARAAKNPKLSSSVLTRIVDHMYDYDTEVLKGIISNPNISRADLVSLARHNDSEIAKLALLNRPDLTANLSVTNEFIYSDRVEMSRIALDLTRNALYDQEASYIQKLIKEIASPDLIEVSLRAISNPVLLDILKDQSEESILIGLSKNRFLAPCSIQSLLENPSKEVVYNLSKYATLNEEQIAFLLNMAIAEADVKLFHNIMEHQALSSTILDTAMQKCPDLYSRFIQENMPHASEDLFNSILGTLDNQLEISLGYNTSINHHMVGELYGIEVEPLTRSLPEGAELSDFVKNVDLPSVLDLIDFHPEEFSEDLLDLALREDLDPDIKTTIVLGLVNRAGNTLQTMNSLQNVIYELPNKLMALIGESSALYQKGAYTFLSSDRFTTLATRNMAQRLKLSTIQGGRRIKEELINNALEIKNEVAKGASSTMEKTKEYYKKALSSVSNIKKINIKKEKRKKSKGQRF